MTGTGNPDESGTTPRQPAPPADAAAGAAPAGGSPAEPSTPPQHVLLVCDQPSWQRVGPIIRRLAVGLIDEAVRVSLVCDGDCPEGMELPGLQASLSLEHHPYRDLLHPTRRYDALVEYARKRRATCIHAISVGCLETALAIKQALGLPLLVTADTTETGPLSLLAEALAPDLLAAPLSGRIREALLGRSINAAEAGRFVEAVAPGIYTHERQRPPFEPGAPVTLLVLESAARAAAFEPVLEATARLLGDGIDVMIFFIDVGGGESHLRRLALQLRIHEHVTFTSRFSRWPQTLGAADVVILPQPRQRFHVYPLEAMSSGTLLVAAAGHCYDAIVDGRTAVEFDPHSREQFAGKLAAILADPQQARSLAYTAQEAVRRDHSVSRMIKAYVDLYTRLARVHTKR